MAIRFSIEQIKKLFVHFNIEPLRKGSFIYGGMGKDTIYRTYKFDYHKDNDILKPGTTNAIAHSLKFNNVSEMKDFIDNNL